MLCFQKVLILVLPCYQAVELKQGRGRGETSHPAAYLAVKRALDTNLLANLDARFPQVNLMDAMKVNAYLITLIWSGLFYVH